MAAPNIFEVIEGSSSKLVRTDDGISKTLHTTGPTPGASTNWWVINEGGGSVVADKPNQPLHKSNTNPFNPETTITYDLPEDAQVEPKIYNLLGQGIRSLVNEQKRAGSYSVAWDGTDSRGAKVASGIYVYKLEAGEVIHVKKMSLLR